MGGQSKQGGPCSAVASDDFCPRRATRAQPLERIILVLGSAIVLGPESVIRSLAEEINPPILAVEVQMDMIAVGNRLRRIESLNVPRMLVAQHVRLRNVGGPPLIVASANGQGVVFIDRRSWKQWELKLRRTILAFEFEPKRMFRIVRPAAIIAADGDAAIDLKPVADAIDPLVVRMEKIFYRALFFPKWIDRSLLGGVGVKARGRAEQVIRFHHDRDGRDVSECLRDGKRSGFVDHVRVHAEIPVRHRAHRLLLYITEKDIRLGVDVGRPEAGPECRRLQGGGFVDSERAGVDLAVALGGGTAVRGVSDFYTRRLACDFQRKRRAEEPTSHTELRVFDVAWDHGGIGSTGSGRIEVAVHPASGKVLQAHVELWDQQKVGPAVGQVHAVDGEHVRASLEMPGKIDRIRIKGVTQFDFHPGGGQRVVNCGRRRVFGGYGMAIEIGHESVIDLHAQRHGDNRGRCIDGKRKAHKDRTVDRRAHRGGQVPTSTDGKPRVTKTKTRSRLVPAAVVKTGQTPVAFGRARLGDEEPRGMAGQNGRSRGDDSSTETAAVGNVGKLLGKNGREFMDDSDPIRGHQRQVFAVS